MTDVKIDRALSIANQTDPFGKRWTCRALEGLGLYTIGILNKNDEFQVPRTYPEKSGLDGRFTKVIDAERAINSYVTRSWDWSEKQDQKQARKQHKDKVANAN